MRREERRIPNRSEALRTILEDYLGDHPELFLETTAQNCWEKSSQTRSLRGLAPRFSRSNVAKLVAEGRGR